MRKNRLSGSEGGAVQPNAPSLPLSRRSRELITPGDPLRRFYCHHLHSVFE